MYLVNFGACAPLADSSAEYRNARANFSAFCSAQVLSRHSAYFLNETNS